FPTARSALFADSIIPELPASRAEATPHAILMGPFEGDSSLFAIGLWIGVGLIEVRAVDDPIIEQSFHFFPIDGAGIDARLAFLEASFRLYFNDIKIVPKGTA